MQYNLTEENMHNYILKKYAPRLHILYNFTKENMHPYILDITLLKKKLCTLHAIGIICGGTYSLNKVIYTVRQKLSTT